MPGALQGNQLVIGPPQPGQLPIGVGQPSKRRDKAEPVLPCPGIVLPRANHMRDVLQGNRLAVGPPLPGRLPIALHQSSPGRDRAETGQFLHGQGINWPQVNHTAVPLRGNRLAVGLLIPGQELEPPPRPPAFQVQVFARQVLVPEPFRVIRQVHQEVFMAEVRTASLGLPRSRGADSPGLALALQEVLLVEVAEASRAVCLTEEAVEVSLTVDM
jgi:hypothetical protein